MEQYNPATCEHKLPNGFTAWQFQSEESSNLGGANKVVISVCSLCGEISIGDFRPSKDGKRTNSFHETFNICHPDAIDAIIKAANFYNEETKWGRISQPPSVPSVLYPFKIKDSATGQIHEVKKYIRDTDGSQSIWCDTWYGHHRIGQDCEWYQEVSASSVKDEYKGSLFQSPRADITIGCISPEARNLLDTIMEKWEEHYKDLKKTAGENHEPTFYGFAYWLCRWSGLIQPAEAASTTQGVVDPKQNFLKVLKWLVEYYNEEGENIALVNGKWCLENEHNIEDVPISEEKLWEIYHMHHPDETGSQRQQAGPKWVKAVNLNKIHIGKEYFYKFYDGKSDQHQGIGNFISNDEFVPFYDYANILRTDFYHLEILDESTPSNESDAVDVLQWAGENGYKYFKEKWYKGGRADRCVGTTSQLYDIFKQKK